MTRRKSVIRHIEEREGKYFLDIYKTLKSQGYRNCDIAVKYNIAQSTINRYLEAIAKLNSLGEYDKVRSTKYKTINKQKIEEQYGMPFKDLLIDLRYNKEMTCDQIAEILGGTKTNIQYHMKNLGISMNVSDARMQSIKTGRTNYSEIQREIRRGHTRNLAKGSSREERTRLTLKNYLDEELSDVFEFVIGFTNWSILKSHEIDIPIIVINTLTNNIYKFAIEYDGSKFHQDTVNELKKTRVEEKGWIFFNIYDNDITDQELENKIEEIIIEILIKLEEK